MKKLANSLFIPVLLCLISMSQQGMAQHDNCGCAGEYAGGVTTKITAVNPFTNKEEVMVVEERDGLYFWQGDIIVGEVGGVASRNVFFNNGFWTNNTIPYQIESGFPAWQVTRINDAAAEVSSVTNLNIIPRTTESIYVSVKTGTGCGAGIGMPSSGVRTISLSINCSYGSTMHEFLHTAGVHHEQTREDRDTYVTINFSNIQAGKEHNFAKNTTNNSDHGVYDYGSIMHYGAYAFAINTSIKTITTAGGQAIGQRTALSASDVAAVNRMYPACTSATLTYGGNIDNGRYKTSGQMNVNGDTDVGSFVLMSAGTKLIISPGAHIKSGVDGKVEFLIVGCNID